MQHKVKQNEDPNEDLIAPVISPLLPFHQSLVTRYVSDKLIRRCRCLFLIVDFGLALHLIWLVLGELFYELRPLGSFLVVFVTVAWVQIHLRSIDVFMSGRVHGPSLFGWLLVVAIIYVLLHYIVVYTIVLAVVTVALGARPRLDLSLSRRCWAPLIFKVQGWDWTASRFAICILSPYWLANFTLIQTLPVNIYICVNTFSGCVIFFAHVFIHSWYKAYP